MAGGADERRQTVALLHIVRAGVLRPGRAARDAKNHEPSRCKPHCMMTTSIMPSGLTVISRLSRMASLTSVKSVPAEPPPRG